MNPSFKITFYLIVTLSTGISSVDMLSVGRVKTYFRKSIQFETNQTISLSQEEVEEFEIGNDIITSIDSHNSEEIPTDEIFFTSDNQRESSVGIQDCGSPGANIKNDSINGCTGDPCIVHPGSIVTVNITFMAKRHSKHLWCDIEVKKSWFHLHFDCPQSDLCTGNSVCPLKPGKIYSIAIKKKLSPRILRYEWLVFARLKDSFGDVLCIASNVRVE